MPLVLTFSFYFSYPATLVQETDVLPQCLQDSGLLDLQGKRSRPSRAPCVLAAPKLAVLNVLQVSFMEPVEPDPVVQGF